MLIITFLDEVLILIIATAIPILWIKHQKTAAVHAGLAAASAWFLALTIKKLFPTNRPYITEQVTALINHPPTDEAFPSAHTATAFAIAAIIYLHHKKWGIIAFFIAALIGLMRILGRVHYPIDIFGGAILGIIIAFIINKQSNHSPA